MPLRVLSHSDCIYGEEGCSEGGRVACLRRGCRRRRPGIGCGARVRGRRGLRE